MKRTAMGILLCLSAYVVHAQYCYSTPGNTSTYGSNNTWIGYVYNNTNLTDYRGYVYEGSSSSPNFDEDFGGPTVNYSTYYCYAYTETFSVRYRLKRSFTNGYYQITVGGDDGYRLSVDGGDTWLIDEWTEHSYQETTVLVHLSGTTKLVLDYYDNSNDNRVSFNISTACSGSENTATYGSGNNWRGYVYSGTDLSMYRGMVSQPGSSNPSFTQNFGGANTTFSTSSCSMTTENFSVRYRLSYNFPYGQYTFIVGGDDGYRLSLDGGATWVINNWSDHSFESTTYTNYLSGTKDMVLDYYENSGDNQLSFSLQAGAPLPIHLVDFDARERNGKGDLNWTITPDSNPDVFQLERSSDGNHFTTFATVAGNTGTNGNGLINFQLTDNNPYPGKTYYRLKMIDTNGIVTYSKIVVVTAGEVALQEISIFPTSYTGTSTFLKTGTSLTQAEISVYNTSGQRIQRLSLGKVEKGQTIPFDALPRQASHGLYVVQVTDNGQLIGSQKIIY